MKLFGSGAKAKQPERIPLRLVVAINRVDQMVPGGWDTRLNQPTEDAARQIQRKAADIVRRLSEATELDTSHIEYYSALKRYRLHHLLNRVVEHSNAGFKFVDVQPKPFEDVEGVDPDVADFTKQERARRTAARGSKPGNPKDTLLAELGRYLSAEDLQSLESKFSTEMGRPPKVAVLGQSGVGKTTTVNALFATDWRTNDVEVGTHDAQAEVVPLPSGGDINIVDLPGYGRSIAEDQRYEQIYLDLIPSCDLVLLIIQADRGDLGDDIEMIHRLNNWLAGYPTPIR
jgi:predicted GTPase